MAGAGQVARGWDLDRIIRNYEQRINTLEKLVRGGKFSTFGDDTPRWRSRLAADATITTGTFTNLAYSLEDTAPELDLGTPAFVSFQTVLGEPRYVFATAGLYLVRCSLQWNVGAGGTRKIHLMKNAGTVPYATTEGQNAGASIGLHIDTVDIIPFDVGDYLRTACLQNSGANVGIIAAGAANDRAASELAIAPLGAYDVA